jgi:hypothetical protein
VPKPPGEGGRFLAAVEPLVCLAASGAHAQPEADALRGLILTRNIAPRLAPGVSSSGRACDFAVDLALGLQPVVEVGAGCEAALLGH